MAISTACSNDDRPVVGTIRPDSTLLPDGAAFPFWEDRTSYRDVYHVAATHPRAADANPGTADEPWKTIGRAAESLQPGQKVVVHAGVFLDIEGFAVSMNDRQPGRIVGGQPIEPRGHQILNNLFAACQRPIFLAGNSGNISDGNLFDVNTPDALFDIQNPAPEPKPGFAEWRKAFGQDAHSSQAPMDVSFDPAAMTLRIACQAIRATSPAVPELGEPNAATVCPGPFDRAACKRLGEGQTVTLPPVVDL